MNVTFNPTLTHLLVGEKFGPNVNESETLSVWISLLARAIPLVKTGEFEEKEITLWKYGS